MPKRTILPTIVAHYDADGVSFTCDGEPIEDVELSWEDLTDPELVGEVAEELIEYVDSDELEDVDNPAGTVRRALKQLANSKIARSALEDADDEDPDEDDYDDDDDED